MTSAQLVLQEYPNAKVTQVGKKKLFECWEGDKYLGKGQSKKAAWKAAYNNNK